MDSSGDIWPLASSALRYIALPLYGALHEQLPVQEADASRRTKRRNKLHAVRASLDEANGRLGKEMAIREQHHPQLRAKFYEPNPRK